MSLVATLIANPQNPVLSPAVAEAVCEALSTTSLYWLADGIACDIPLPDGASSSKTDSIIRKAIGDQPIDVVVQNDEHRRKKVLLADMDSTVIGQECIDELAAHAGLKDQVSAITARAMNGEIDFDPALRERVGLLKGLPLSVIDDVWEHRITLTPGGRELIATMRANGGYAALVSGGFTVFTGKVAEAVGFQEHRANQLAHAHGHLIGTVIDPILGKEAKVEALRDIVKRLSLNPDDVLAVGDGANDLGMLQLAGTGVALHAKPVVAEQASVRIDHGDLTALLYLQGYRKSDFVHSMGGDGDAAGQG